MNDNDGQRVTIARYNVLDDRRAIFVHIPKTGGSSIRRLLGLALGDYSHPTAREYETAYPEAWREYFKFAVVRNPWDRFVSAYFYNLSIADRIPNRIRRRIKRHGDDFGGFVRKFGRQPEFLLTSSVAFRLQSEWADGLDLVGRFEELPMFAEDLARRFALSTSLERHNASERGSYQRYYDDETAALVGELYAEDVAKFGYRFGS